jgi:ZIP family zinc transporter
MLEMILCSLFAGITIFIGGLLGSLMEKYSTRTIETYVLHWTVAFGGGLLVAAVAFVLVPNAVTLLSIPAFSIIFLSGAVVFYLIDKAIETKGGLLAQTMAMLMDFIPEAIALGAVFAKDHKLGILLAFFIGFQNLPESFNAYFDLRKSDHSSNKILRIFLGLSVLGVVSALIGKTLLSTHAKLTDSIMLFAAGGILYLIFQDIAPQSKIRKHWEPALGASLGFLVGMIGTKIFS